MIYDKGGVSSKREDSPGLQISGVEAESGCGDTRRNASFLIEREPVPSS